MTSVAADQFVQMITKDLLEQAGNQLKSAPPEGQICHER
jgi:hypothetical protein